MLLPSDDDFKKPVKTLVAFVDTMGVVLDHFHKLLTSRVDSVVRLVDALVCLVDTATLIHRMDVDVVEPLLHGIEPLCYSSLLALDLLEFG